MVEKSVKNYIEWYSQNTKRLNFGQRYEDIIVIADSDIMMFGHMFNRLYYTVLCCIILYSTILYYTFVCCIILRYTM